MGRGALCWGVFPKTAPRLASPRRVPAPSPTPSLTDLGDKAKARSKPAVEPGSLAEGRCPPDSGCGRLFLSEGASFKLLPWSLREGDHGPSPPILLAGENQHESFGKRPAEPALGNNSYTRRAGRKREEMLLFSAFSPNSCLG